MASANKARALGHEWLSNPKAARHALVRTVAGCLLALAAGIALAGAFGA